MNNKQNNIDETLLQITGGHFCAGLELKNDKVVKSAPILRYMNGWSEYEVRRYCNKKRWDVISLK